MKKGFLASSLSTNKFPDAVWVHLSKIWPIRGWGGLFLEYDQKCNQAKSKPSFRYGAPLHALWARGHSVINFFWLFVRQRDFPHWSCKLKFSFCTSTIKSFIDQACLVKMAEYLPCSFLCFYGTWLRLGK